MFAKNSGLRTTPIVIVLAVIFTIGLVLGTVSLFYIPSEVVYEARITFDEVNTKSVAFSDIYKNNLIMELGWLAVIWMLGSMNITAPFSAAVMSVRGFLIGFSIAFVLTGEDNVLRLILTSILPQCVTALPVMTVFSMVCIRFSVERKHTEGMDAKYFAMCIFFVFVTALVALIESVLTKVFINM